MLSRIVIPEATPARKVEGYEMAETNIIEDDDIDDHTWHILDSTFQKKYQVDEGSPYICVNPNRVLAWDGGITTMTRWLFDR